MADKNKSIGIVQTPARLPFRLCWLHVKSCEDGGYIANLAPDRSNAHPSQAFPSCVSPCEGRRSCVVEDFAAADILT